MSDPWTASFRSPSPGASSSDEDRPQTPPYARLSRDAELARELDLSKREDTAVFKATPFSIAKAQAHHAATIKAQKSLYRHTSNSSSSSGGKPAPPRGPVPALPDEVVSATSTSTFTQPAPGKGAAAKRKGPVPVIGAEALSKKPAARGWTKDSVWKTGANVYIPAAAPPPKPPKETKAKGGKGKKKVEEEAAKEEESAAGTAPLSRIESLLRGVDEHLIAEAAEGAKGKGKAKAKPRAPAKRKKADDDEGEGEAPKKKKAGGRKKKADKEEEKITFGRIPAGATADSDYPIIQSFENQKKLPAKTTAAKSKATTTKKTPKFTAPKAKAPATAKTPKKKAFTTLSFLSESSHEDVISSINLSNLLPTKPSEGVAGSKKVEQAQTGGEGVDVEDELIHSDAEGDNTPEEEKEGKKEVMSKFFGTATSASADTKVGPSTGDATRGTPSKEQEAQDPPSTMTHVNFNFPDKQPEESPIKAPDTSSSQLPYSSPLAGKGDPEILKPKPVRHKDADALAKLVGMDEKTIEKVLEAQRQLAKQQTGLAVVQNGGGFQLPHTRRKASPKSKILPLHGSDTSPPSARKPGFATSGVFSSQALKSGNFAPALGRPLQDPYQHSDYDKRKAWGTLPQSKWAAKASYAGTYQVQPLPSDFNRTGTHYRSSSPLPAPRSPQPAAAPVHVGAPAPKFRVAQIWTPTPAAAAPPPPPQQTYRVETNQGTRYGAAAESGGNPFEEGGVFTAGENGQPRFRGQTNAFVPSRPALTGNHPNRGYIEEVQGENWEDGWKVQTGGFPVQERMQPVPRLEAPAPRAQRPYAPPALKPVNRFNAPAAVHTQSAHSKGNPIRRRF